MEEVDDRRPPRYRVRQFFLELNVFESDATDQETINIQRWSSRVYIFFLLTGMLILLVYNGIRVDTQQFEVNNPSLETYLTLQNVYANQIKCPCTQISASFSSFVELNLVYHDICTSQFISQEWINLLFDNMTSMRYAVDFRATASLQFQVLRELCALSQTTINNNIQTFYTEELISGYLLSEQLFKAEVEAMIEDFRTSTVTYFLESVSFFRSFILGNAMMSGIQTPYTMLIYTSDDVEWYPDIQLNFYQNQKEMNGSCTCDVNATCNLPAAFYDVEIVDDDGILDGSAFNASFRLDNWFVGCWAIESLLLSSLNNSFLENQTALDTLSMYFNFTSNSTPIVLNELITTNESNTFDDLLQTLFIKDLSPQLDYSAYFAQCRPQACIYTTTQRSSFLYMLTSLLGLYGGFSVVLRFLVPYVVTFLNRVLKRMLSVLPHDSADDNNSDNIAITATPWRQRVRTVVQYLWHSIVHFNLFKSSFRQQPSDLLEQRWTTRLYIVLLTLALVILTSYSMLRPDTRLIEVTNPTLSIVENLQQSQINGLASSLRCECTQLTVPYGKLLQLQPLYHQVCSSDFVSLRWIAAIAQTIHAVSTENYYLDFHNAAPLFYLLGSMCDFSNKTILNSLQQFEQVQLVSAELLSVDLFTNQMLSAIDQFKQETTNKFLRSLLIMRNLTYVNQILTGSFTNFDVQIANSPAHAAALSIWSYTTTLNNLSTTCSCANDPSCKTITGIFTGQHGNWTCHYTIPGLYTACFPVESLLQSTLECFYDNQDCLTFLINYYNASFFSNFTQLNSSAAASRFATNSTIGTLLGELFIEKWSGSPNYTAYFDQCQPASCSYQISRSNTVLETLTKIVALIGGLSISLRTLAPLLIAACTYLIRRWTGHQHASDQSDVHGFRLATFGRKIQVLLNELNVFEDPNHTRNIQHERRATRVYMVILGLSLFILLLYTSIGYSVTTFTVQNPSFDQFKEMQNRYDSNDLICPCSYLSITYSSFVNLKCGFHQVCTSQFVSDSYIQELFRLYNELDMSQTAANAFTLQGTIFTHFQTLFILCNLVQDAVNDASQQFLASSFVSADMIDYGLFDKNINVSLMNFLSTLPSSFSNPLQLIRGMTQANGLVSAYATNWYPVPYNLQQVATMYLHPQYYGNDSCNCATSSACTQPSTPFIPGYIVGCTPLESLLRSTIECLYEESCVDLLDIYLNTTLPSPTSLNKAQTRFSPNDTVDSIVQQMFIETCSSNVSYEQFFNECLPLSCSVTITERNKFIVVFTTLIGFYGGLTTFLKLVVPFFLSWFYKLVRIWQRRRIQIQVQPVLSNAHQNADINSIVII